MVYVLSWFRLMRGSSSIHDDAEDVEEQPLVRRRTRQASSGSGESEKEIGVVEASSPSNPGQQDAGNLPRNNGNAFPSDEVKSCMISTDAQ